MERVIDTEKVDKFNFLNEEVEEFTSSCSQRNINARTPRYLK